MEKVSFRTLTPSDGVPRALDLMRTMGFELVALEVRREEDSSYRVCLDYVPRGTLSSHTFLRRLARFPGVELSPAVLGSRTPSSAREPEPDSSVAGARVARPS